MSVIVQGDTPQDMVVKMAEGNVGALGACMELMKHGATIDPNRFSGGHGLLVILDDANIRGVRLHLLYADFCNKDIVRLCACARAMQRLADDWYDKIVDAVDAKQRDRRQGTLDVDQILRDLQAVLPRFGVEK